MFIGSRSFHTRDKLRFWTCPSGRRFPIPPHLGECFKFSIVLAIELLRLPSKHNIFLQKCLYLNFILL